MFGFSKKSGENRKENILKSQIAALKLEIQDKNILIKSLQAKAAVTSITEEICQAGITDRIRRDRDEGRAKIGEIFLAHGFISESTLEEAIKFQQQYGGNITQFLLNFGYITEQQLAQCLTEQFSIPYLPLSAYNISEDAIKLIPADVAASNWLIPVNRQGDCLMVVMFDPLDSAAITAAEDASGCKVIPFVGIISEIIAALEVYYKIVINQEVRDGRKIIPMFVDSSLYQGPERRRSARYPVNIDIQFPSGGYYKRGKTKNVSREGICFDSDASLPMDSIITIEIDLPLESGFAPVPAVLQVVRVERLDSGRFEIAGKVFKIANNDLTAIIEFASRIKP